MRTFFRNNNGAVTVFVTLLLIPAVLVSGTGVDLSRLYAARGVVHNANQLAANSILTSYDSLLQDLYGLYAVINKDDNLTEMVDTYVKATLFGEVVTDAKLGEFKLFWGSENCVSSVESFGPLSNVEILRRQIEEYAKWRVPVAMISAVLDKLKSKEVEEMAANNEAIIKKLKVDEKVQEAVEKYIILYERINSIEGLYNDLEKEVFDNVVKYRKRIQEQIEKLSELRSELKVLRDNSEEDINIDTTEEETSDIEEVISDILEHYDAIIDNIKSLTNGGVVGKQWDDGTWKEEVNDIGLVGTINEDINKLNKFKKNFDELITICIESNEIKDTLKIAIEELETILNEEECHEELRKNITEEIKSYKKLIEYDFKRLAEEMKNKDINYIDTKVIKKLENARSLLPTMIMGITLLDSANELLDNKLSEIISDLNSITFMAPNGFVKFRNCGTEHNKCYYTLKNLGGLDVKSDGDLNDKEKKEKKNILNLFKAIKDLWNGLTDYDTSPGATSYTKIEGYSGQGFGSTPKGATFNLEVGGFNNLKDTLKTLTKLVTGDITIQKIFSNVLNDVSNRILLVGYDVQMFSNWTTSDTEENISMTGEKISVDNNYFYRSELEYIYNGSMKAKENLKTASTTLLIIRFIANYASSYIIREVNTEIKTYETIVAAIPYAGAALRLFIRPLIVLTESIIDLSALRNNNSIVLLKTNNDDWVFSISNMLENITEEKLGNLSPETDDEKGFYYSDYLMIFLLLGNPNVIASRTGDLIALNVTTVRDKIIGNNPETKNEDERAKAMESVKLFDLSESYTSFAIKTETEVRFSFLSMSFAQKSTNEVELRKRFPISKTDYRGY